MSCLSDDATYYIINREKIIFQGENIKTKIINLTPEALAFITENDIPTDEPCEFYEEDDFKLFSLLYYSTD